MDNASTTMRAIERGVYYLLREGRVVYVGSSRNIFHRIGSHIEDRKIEFDSWRWDRVEEERDRYELANDRIAFYQPEYNVKSNGKWSQSNGGRFDKVAYQRWYMRQRRAKAKALTKKII